MDIRESINLIERGLATPDQLVDMKAAVKLWIDLAGESDSGWESIVQDYQYENDIEDDDDEEDEDGNPKPQVDVSDTPEFREWLLDHAESAIWDAWGRFSHLFNDNGSCRVYRAITAPADWTPEPGRHPGIYWSWDKRNAEAHWGTYSSGHVEWLMTADVPVEDIDWPITLAMNASHDYETECEIRLREDTHVHILSVERTK